MTFAYEMNAKLKEKKTALNKCAIMRMLWNIMFTFLCGVESSSRN